MIHIPKDIYSKLTFLSGESNYISNSPAVVYDDLGINFLADLSKNLLGKDEIRKYPDVATFAFWCRSSNLKKIINNPFKNDLRVGLGMVYHNSPSNVPINFAFSLAFGILSGNSSVIRLSSKESDSASFIISILTCLLYTSDAADE